VALCTALYHDSSLNRSGMARVNEGSHSFTCHPHVLYTSGVSHACLCSPAAGHHGILAVLIPHPAEGRRLSWPGLGLVWTRFLFLLMDIASLLVTWHAASRRIDHEATSCSNG